MRMILGTDSARGLGGSREWLLRVAFAALPCAVLLHYLPVVLGQAPRGWVVPLWMAFVNALAAVSLARQYLARRGFLVFWACYGLLWVVVAWHGIHFLEPPRPAALLMNLGEISEVPWPDWSEVPWLALVAVIALGGLSLRPASPGARLRFATQVAIVLLVGSHAAALLRYRTGDMMRLSGYRDLVRTHGLEGAALLDGVALLESPGSKAALRALRLEETAHPPAMVELDPVAVDREVIVQVESLDLAALGASSTPTLHRLWSSATHGLVDPLRSSLSGSSGSDFQLLTGLRPQAGIPSYRLTWDHDPAGLPEYAEARGFAFHAYHGNDSNFWNRGPFFRAMGVTFHAMEAIPATEFSRWGRADGDLFRYAATQIGQSAKSVHFLITLSTHAPYDLVDPAAHQANATTRERYLLSMAYVDRALGWFLAALPSQGTTLVALYGDHSSNLFAAEGAEAESPVPMILGVLQPDGSLAQLHGAGRAIGALPRVYELAALHRYLEACLDAKAP
jgi:hypothetical protein